MKSVCAELEDLLHIAELRYTSRTDIVEVVEIDAYITYLYKIANR